MNIDWLSWPLVVGLASAGGALWMLAWIEGGEDEDVIKENPRLDCIATGGRDHWTVSEARTRTEATTKEMS